MRKFFYLLILMIFGKASQSQVLIDIGTTVLETSTLYTTTDLPWELKYGPGDSLWMTTRQGRIYRIHPTNGGATLLLDHSASIWQVSESGLLGMAFDPNFSTSPHVYVVYTYTSAGNNRERLSRFTYSGNSLTSELVLLDGGLINANSIHNGSRLVVLPDNTLLMTTGDANNTSTAQNPNSLNGKILRINLDGSIPSDNPNPASYVYTSGHRNPQGLMLHPNGRVYQTEHGPSNNDEFQIIEAGRNYGWPTVEGFCDDDKAGEITFCNANNVMQPLASWNVIPGGTWAPNDLEWYSHSAIPEFQNTILVTFLKTNKVRRITLNAAGTAITGQQDFFINQWGRLRDIAVSPSGEIFLATNTSPFRIIRMRNSAVVPVSITNYRISCADNKSMISWRTESELTNKHFILYAGDHQSTMQQVAIIPSQAQGGTSTTPLNYSFVVPPAMEKQFYKIVSEDIDGVRHELNTLTEACGNTLKISMYPNPAHGQATININGNASPLNIIITDSKGAVVHRARKVDTYSIPVGEWGSGVYIVTVLNHLNEPVFKEKLIVQ